MKVQVFLFVAALFCAKSKVRAQNCYQCLSITTTGEGLDLPATETQLGFEPCDDPLPIMDCSAFGGCMKADYTFLYDVAGYGKEGVGVLVRTCGAPVDLCQSEKELQEAFAAQQDILQPLLPSGTTFVSATGDACLCTGELCNSAPVWNISFGVLLVSLLVSYMSI